MTKFTRTLITSLVLFGSASTAHAAENSFATTVKVDTTVSAHETYSSLKAQAKKACRQEAEKSGYSLRDLPQAQLQKCEMQVLKNAVERIDNRMLTAFHNRETGVKAPARLYAKN